MLKSLVLAFSTYSKIPMPKVEWDKKSMRHSMCFFPFVGAVIGVCFFGLLYFLMSLNYSYVMTAALLTALPVIITGGIHVDGFLDTVDALSSYRDREEKLRILKDSHTGAFAIVFGIVYFLMYFGFMSQLTVDFEDDNFKTALLVSVGFVYSRALSGLSVVALKKARKDGIVAGISDASPKGVKAVLVLELLACVTAFCIIDPLRGTLAALVGVIVFLYYRSMAYRHFGGVTGDLAGFFLQICELAILASCTL